MLDKVRNIGIMAHVDAGKTTTTGKLAKLLREEYKRKPLLVSCDVYRPAAIEQLACPQVAAGTPIRKALNYLTNHWDALTHFLRDGHIPIHNNCHVFYDMILS